MKTVILTLTATALLTTANAKDLPILNLRKELPLINYYKTCRTADNRLGVQETIDGTPRCKELPVCGEGEGPFQERGNGTISGPDCIEVLSDENSDVAV